jgi:CRP/FNR family transcriptional regulator, cyclic AMP receptor protein
VLKQVSLFSNLNEQLILELEAICKVRSFARNVVVISEGERSDCLYIVISGKAHALRIDETGRQFVVNRFGPLDYFGEMSFFDGDARCATVMTKDPCELMLLPRQAFLDLASKHPDILWNVNKALLAKLRAATEQIDALVFMDVYSRLARFLIEHQGKDHVVTEKFTQQELADIVGASRETVNRIFNDLIAGGNLSKDKDRIVIHDLPYNL